MQTGDCMAHHKETGLSQSGPIMLTEHCSAMQVMIRTYAR